MADVSAEDMESIRASLDRLGLALVEYDHTWSAEERAGYERAIKIMADWEKQHDH